jgi:hypothetical protein
MFTQYVGKKVFKLKPDEPNMLGAGASNLAHSADRTDMTK